jgi:phospholipid/cholesterol/gamma-HCH transport system permease protein
MKKAEGKIQKQYDYELDGDNGVLHLKGDLILSKAMHYEKEVLGSIVGDVKVFTLDLKAIGIYDSYIVLIINRLKKHCLDNGIEFRLSGTTPSLDDFLRVMLASDGKSIAHKKQRSPLYRYIVNVGENAVSIWHKTYDYLAFMGDLSVKMLYMFFKPGSIRWKDLPFYFTRSGVDALFIVLLIVFLIGVITGYQGALQLQRFGADIFIADLIGISITRELAPLMTAILVAGRSGSAFAAEIGTMKVSEEIDALNSLGFDHMTFLVVPRVIAVMLAMPLLTILADVAGIAGGLLTAVTTLDITIVGYINQLDRALTYGHVFSGLIKSVVFGFLVASVGCFSGMQVRGGAESVGKFTTTAVVSGVLLIIISDAIFTFLFQAINF